MQRVGLLNGLMSEDFHFGMLVEGILNDGVLKGLEVTTGRVSTGKCLIKATKTDGKIVILAYENTGDIIIDTSGSKKVFITVNQEILDNPGSNNTGENIATVQVGENYPNNNFIKLASVTADVILDERDFIKVKGSGELLTELNINFDDYDEATGNNLDTFLLARKGNENKKVKFPLATPTASTSRYGITRIATNSEAQNGGTGVITASQVKNFYEPKSSGSYLGVKTLETVDSATEVTITVPTNCNVIIIQRHSENQRILKREGCNSVTVYVDQGNREYFTFSWNAVTNVITYSRRNIPTSKYNVYMYTTL